MVVDRFSVRNELIDLIYSAVEDSRLWSVFLERFVLAMNGTEGLFVNSYPNQLEWNLQVAYGITEEQQQEYAANWASKDPWVATETIKNIPLGKVVPSQELCPDEILVETEFYRKMLLPNDWHYGGGVHLARTGQQYSAMSVLRPYSRGPLTAEEIAFWQSLVPHLLRGVALQDSLFRLQLERDVLTAHFEEHSSGMALLNGKGFVLAANRQARAILKEADGLRLDGELVTAVDKTDAHRLAALIDRVGEPRTGSKEPVQILVRRKGKKGPLVVLLSPVAASKAPVPGAIQPAILVQIIDPSARRPVNTELLRTLFGLTPAEAQVASQIASGATAAETAKTLFVSVSTIRSHLQRVLEKTGVRRQAELVELVTRIALPTSSEGKKSSK